MHGQNAEIDSLFAHTEQGLDAILDQLHGEDNEAAIMDKYARRQQAELRELIELEG